MTIIIIAIELSCYYYCYLNKNGIYIKLKYWKTKNLHTISEKTENKGDNGKAQNKIKVIIIKTKDQLSYNINIYHMK